MGLVVVVGLKVAVVVVDRVLVVDEVDVDLVDVVVVVVVIPSNNDALLHTLAWLTWFSMALSLRLSIIINEINKSAV